MSDRRFSIYLVTGVAIVGAFAVIAHGRMRQDPGYHLFADHRRLLGIPNFWNVGSNLPLFVVGLAGLLILFRRPTPGVLPPLVPSYVAFFLGTTLVAIGSGYYHLAPSDDTLVWDRLPMTITFMAFLAILIGEQIAPRIGAGSLVPLLVIGVLSVAYWWFTDQRGHDDLRPYMLVQFLPFVLTPLLLALFRSPFTRRSLLWGVFGAYGLAKVLEGLDAPIFRASPELSGHSLKHLAAGLGAYLVILAAMARDPRVETVYPSSRASVVGARGAAGEGVAPSRSRARHESTVRAG